MKKIYKVNVRHIVEYVFRSGDIYAGTTSNERLIEGIQGHNEVRKDRPGYTCEVPIDYNIELDDYIININGRIDGVFMEGNTIILDEIKTTYYDLDSISSDDYPEYWAQIKMYAFFYCFQNHMDKITYQLTYYNLTTKESRVFRVVSDQIELEVYFNKLLINFIDWLKIVFNWQMNRDLSIKELNFPFEKYRKGQKTFMKEVYKTIKSEEILFAQAPTGTGKTISTLFPAIKALGNSLSSKIFYLTAKSIAKSIASDTVKILKDNGLKMKTIIITAKEKSCLNGRLTCDPYRCNFADGHYDRVNTAVKDIFNNHDIFDMELIHEYSKKHMVCPFEFSLDISLYCDCIICDYNYLFDPQAYLKRFFEFKSDYIFLIDETHNLPDRAREMYSAELTNDILIEYKTLIDQEIFEIEAKLRPETYAMNFEQTESSEPQKPFRSEEKRKIRNELNNIVFTINNLLDYFSSNMDYFNENYYISGYPEGLSPILEELTERCESYFELEKTDILKDQLLDFYFLILGMHRMKDVYKEKNEDYITYYEKDEDSLRIKILCLDPSMKLRESINKGRSAIFFSATLTPEPYFVRVLGNYDRYNSLDIPSPFPKENLKVIVNDEIPTRYKMRYKSIEKLAEIITAVALAKTGNYLVFFPSYEYMNNVYESFYQGEQKIDSIIQSNNMSEKEKEAYVQRFNEYGKRSLVGFAVIGGTFGEGIDLIGDKLSGVIIVGIGLPKICLERNLIKNYFDREEKGFQYAYLYPSINKVLQAAGRVIRSENDRGIILLIDDRFRDEEYTQLLPYWWDPFYIINEINQLYHFIKNND